VEESSADHGAVSVAATKAVSPLLGATSYCHAVKQLLTSVVREICTLRSVGAGARATAPGHPVGDQQMVVPTATVAGPVFTVGARSIDYSVSASGGNLLEQSLILHGPFAEQCDGFGELVAGCREAVVNMRGDNWMNQSVEQSALLQLP
jgi:hypothetical protein